MKFTEAFGALGYRLVAPRTDWSAASGSGVCLSIWGKEAERSKGKAFDTRLDASPIEQWGHKRGNTRRKQHLECALTKFDGIVDVVFVTGTPGDSYGTAHPWAPERRGDRWFVTFFDPETGHFAAEVRALSEAK